MARCQIDTVVSRSVLRSATDAVQALLKSSVMSLGPSAVSHSSLPPYSVYVVCPKKLGGPVCGCRSRSILGLKRPRTTSPSWIVSGTSEASPKVDCSSVVMCACWGGILVRIAVLALHLHLLTARLNTERGCCSAVPCSARLCACTLVRQ